MILISLHNNLNKLWFLLSLLLIIFFTSCEKEEEEDSLREGDTVTAYFTFNNPAKTKAFTAETENSIITIDILIFKVNELDEEIFAYHTEGEITYVGDEIQAKANVIISSDRHRLVVLANAREEITRLGGITQTGIKDLVLNRIITEYQDAWKYDYPNDYKAIPMWGEYTEIIEITENTSLSGLSLLKCLARIDVHVDINPDKTETFELRKVYLFNANNRGKIIPDPGNWDKDSKQVTAPSLPELNKPQIAPEENYIQYISASESELSHTIYTCETKAPDPGNYMQATCLVIGGSYNDDEETSYYRVDFVTSKNIPNPGDILEPTVFDDILRNHLYNVRIIAVTERGYLSPDSAFLYKQTDMTVDITTWNDYYGKYEHPGYYRLWVSKSKIQAPATGYEGIIEVLSNNPEPWTVSSNQEDWLEVSKTNEESFSVKVKNGSNRTGTISVEVDGLTKIITVVQ